ncbi:TadE family protein [Paenibacillus arenosi]|uniref:Pilus assembly protein n=1 Tax=Paenibacillus arenosi TaxID=2774142 RepID=A0ABR9B0T7_9BACL|nr:TadE family protein [Paenibacillus arenosi]MBD8500011.1 pilus assembly protein [Paenibacillus arenosi]
MKVFRKWRWLSREDGAAIIIEASIVFPIILLCTLIMLFLGIMIYLKAITAHGAVLSSERAGVIWSNSNKHPLTGAFPQHTYDKLYWRALDDKLIDRVFQGGGADSAFSIALPNTGSSGSLAEKKLGLSAEHIPNAYKGSMEYGNSLVERTVTTYLQEPVKDNVLERLSGKSIEVDGTAVTAVVEPAEFIRTVQFVRYMQVKLTEMSGTLGATPREAGSMIQRAAAP